MPDVTTARRPRRQGLRTLLIVAATALALSIGTIGAASAAELTKSTVRKIAAKVVKKKAGKLHVAHADTAASATLLGGFTAGQLRTTEYRYAIPAIAPNSVVLYTFPGLPDGSYHVSYWYRATTTVPTARVACDVTPSASDPTVAEGFGVSDGSGTSRGGAAGGLTTTTGPVTLFCNTSSGNLTMFGQVSFVRVDTVLPGTAVGS